MGKLKIKIHCTDKDENECKAIIYKLIRKGWNIYHEIPSPWDGVMRMRIDYWFRMEREIKYLEFSCLHILLGLRHLWFSK